MHVLSDDLDEEVVHSVFEDVEFLVFKELLLANLLVHRSERCGYLGVAAGSFKLVLLIAHLFSQYFLN